jgi:hypothetical protein
LISLTSSDSVFPFPYRERRLSLFRRDGTPAPTALWPLRYKAHTLMSECTMCYVEGRRIHSLIDPENLFSEAREIEFIAMRERKVSNFIKSYKHDHLSEVVESAVKEAERRVLTDVVDRVVAAANGEQVEAGAQEKLSPKNIYRVLAVLQVPKPAT